MNITHTSFLLYYDGAKWHRWWIMLCIKWCLFTEGSGGEGSRSTGRELEREDFIFMRIWLSASKPDFLQTYCLLFCQLCFHFQDYGPYWNLFMKFNIHPHWKVSTSLHRITNMDYFDQLVPSFCLKAKHAELNEEPFHSRRDIMPCGLLKVNRRFKGTYRLNLQRQISQAR